MLLCAACVDRCKSIGFALVLIATITSHNFLSFLIRNVLTDWAEVSSDFRCCTSSNDQGLYVPLQLILKPLLPSSSSFQATN